MSSSAMEFSYSLWKYFKSLLITATEQFNNEMDDDTYTPVPKITLLLKTFLQGLHNNNDAYASNDKL